jgi:hypothetical protein
MSLHTIGSGPQLLEENEAQRTRIAELEATVDADHRVALLNQRQRIELLDEIIRLNEIISEHCRNPAGPVPNDDACDCCQYRWLHRDEYRTKTYSAS